MPTSDPTSKQPSAKPDANQGKPTIEHDNRDENVGQRERTKSGPTKEGPGFTPGPGTDGGKPTVEQDDRGKHYGQREGSTVTEDNDVE